MVKLEEDPAAPELPMSPFDGDDCYDDDEDEEADSEGDGDGAARRRGGAPSLKKGPWTPDEDKRLKDYVQAHGDGNWNQVRINAGLNRCGKSCRLRWSNHLRPDLKKGPFDDEEVDKIIRMHMSWGNKWAKMAAHLPGRTDNEIKNYWNTRLKRHQRAGLPIYPEYLVCQASNRDMNFDTPEDLRGTKRPNEFSQNVLGIDLMHEYFDPKVFNKRVLNMGDLPSPSFVVPNSLPMDAMNPLKQLNSTGCIASDYNGSLSFVQFPDESEKAGCSPSFNYGMTENQLATLDNAITSCHPIIDGNPSTSWIPQRSMEMELPSFQYSNYDISNAWLCDYPSASPVEQADTLIESAGSLKSESISSQNTGLEAIAHNGDGTGDPMKSQEVSLPLPCNQVSQSFSSVLGDDTLNFGMLDASLEAFLNGGSLFSKDHSISINNSLIDGDSCEEAKLPTAGRGLDSFPWNSMPGACNISDFSNL